MTTQDSDATPAELPVLAAPAEPVTRVVATQADLNEAIDRLGSGEGPVAVDTERAHGYRYSARAYLIQLRRSGAGTLLIDPIPFAGDHTAADFGALQGAISDAEWIIHAASQDLPCLAEIGMVPPALFDTELAGRLLGIRRVGLGALVEAYFGQRLLKEHSAADWSKRPLPEDWLTYAALDVELLIELRQRLLDDLVTAEKDEWARQEFEWLTHRAGIAPTPRTDPWRRTSGIHAVRSPAGLAVVRELWTTRDRIAQRLDRAPGRILPDRAIAALATRPTPNQRDLRSVDGFQRRTARRYEAEWLAALERVAELSKAELPPLHRPAEGPPPPRSWEQRQPEAYGRYLALRAVMNELADRHDLPAENLLTPEHWRRLAWEPPEPLTAAAVDDFLATAGARQWQRDIVVGPLTAALLG